MTNLLLKKQGFPEDGELVLCTVTAIHYHSVFVVLDEYQKTGLIHISEIAPGRIRNIRDYVVENKKIVCLVLSVNHEKGHIDLSLRRVNEGQKRAKINEIKQEQIAEKIIEILAKNLKIEPDKIYNEISEKALKKFNSLYQCFEEEVKIGNVISSFGMNDKLTNTLIELIRQRIKEHIVRISGELRLGSYKPNGVEIIKSILLTIKELGSKSVILSYLGGGRYHLEIYSDDYKKAEKLLNKLIDYAKVEIENIEGTMEFQRSGG